MSWDFSMCVDAGGSEPAYVEGCDANYTYNVSPMFYDAFPNGDGIRGLCGLTGEEALAELDAAIRVMAADPAKYRAMDPPNGWGDYEGALRLLRELREWCEAYPKARMRVS